MDTRDTRDTRAGDARSVGRDVRDERLRDVPDVRTDRTAPPAPPATPAADARDRSISDLLKELRDESTVLLRQEVALAKTEMSEKASVAARNAASIAAGGAVAFAGVLILLISAAVGLALLLAWWGLEINAWWLGPLIVGGVVALIGYGMIQKGVSTLKRQSPVPEKTVHSLQEDKQWIQDKTS